MTSSTLAENLIKIRRYLHESDGQKSFWSDDLLRQIFNSSYRRRASQLVMAYEGYFSNVAIIDIVANQASYPWPPGFERSFKLEIKRADGTTLPLTRFERHEDMNPVASSGTSGDSYYPCYRPIGGGFVLEPGPLETIVNGLRLEYYGTPPELTLPDSRLHPDFPVSFEELLILDSAIAAMDSEGMMEMGQVKTLLRLRQEWEFDWERYIDGRIGAQDFILPFAGHYLDS